MIAHTRAIAAALLLSVPLAAGAQSVVPRHIAAPPDDITSGILRLPDPAALGHASRSAVIPLTFTTSDEGISAAGVRVPIDEGRNVRIAPIGPGSADWRMRIDRPGREALTLHRLIPPSSPDVELRTGPIGIPGLDAQTTAARFPHAPPGEWDIHLHSAHPVTDGFLLVTSDSPVRLYTHPTTLQRVVGRPVGLSAFLYEGSEPVTRDTRPLRAVITSATARITEPNGNTFTRTLSDDGAAPDAAHNDGRYAFQFIPHRAGPHTIQVLVKGRLPNGRALVRTTQHVIDVSEPLCELAGDASLIEKDGRLHLNLAVHALAPGEKVFAAAELWIGRQPLCWVGAMTRLDHRGRVSIEIDPRWLDLRAISVRPELHNVRIQDPDTWALLDTADVLLPDLDIRPRNGARHARVEPGMLKGRYDPGRALPAPAPRSGARAFGAHNLMLVHGYCSSGVWPTADFTGFTEVFLDENMNRSHDQFAMLLQQFGAGSKSFGVVAHSQGGAAALHLYTFYWSGLDWADGPRLIQSVGTPYQGTPLAGDLALLGEVFGSGCGENNDMTVDGAALWLANIPTWARQKVHYWTTSFTDDAGWDYCNIATDFFLTDPEDGVVEQSRAQLPGANNMGHIEGWCHTTGMRDPAQFLDPARNQDMNANAAR